MLLEVNNVTKKFGGLTAIKNLSFSIEEGGLRCIIGPNGSGKTTLFNLITGQFRATEGHILFSGLDITRYDKARISSMGLCRKFQNPNVFEDLLVSDNLRVAAISDRKVSHMFKKEDEPALEEEIENVLQRIDMLNKKDMYASSLSHGEKQWLEIGMVLIKKPRLILLDEPTAGMTSQETNKTVEIIKNIGSEYTCIVIEHDLDFIKDIGGNITVFNRGEVLARGTYEEISANQTVRDVYLGDEI